MMLSQIKSLEIQLAVLKKQCEQQGGLKQLHSFGDLYGVAGPVDITAAEIDAVLYCFDEDGFERIGSTAPKPQ